MSQVQGPEIAIVRWTEERTAREVPRREIKKQRREITEFRAKKVLYPGMRLVHIQSRNTPTCLNVNDFPHGFEDVIGAGEAGDDTESGGFRVAVAARERR